MFLTPRFSSPPLNFIKRSLTNIKINSKSTETIFERSDYPINKCNSTLSNERITILGYGPQGRGQSLNLRDNGFNISMGLRKGPSWAKAVDDGWEPSVNLFEIEEACDRGTIISYLLSDAGQVNQWPTILPYLTENKTLYFSHGFGITYSNQTNIIPPENIDVVMVSPKGSGLTVRTHFLNDSGINSSFAIHNDHTGNAQEKCLAMAFGIGSGHVFETTFENETYSDLLGERCLLMGLIKGAISAQYNILRKNGHSASEAYNETIEEAFDSLYPLINENGMEWLYKNCSTTAQRGALDWSKVFQRELEPLIEHCYLQVKTGVEAEIVLDKNSDPDYKIHLDEELQEMKKEELWIVGEQLRKLRPSNKYTYDPKKYWGKDAFLL